MLSTAFPSWIQIQLCPTSWEENGSYPIENQYISQFFTLHTLSLLISHLHTCSRRILWGTGSKCLLKSWNTTCNAFPSPMRQVTFWQQENQSVRQEFPSVISRCSRLTLALFFHHFPVVPSMTFSTIFPAIKFRLRGLEFPGKSKPLLSSHIQLESIEPAWTSLGFQELG